MPHSATQEAGGPKRTGAAHKSRNVILVFSEFPPGMEVARRPLPKDQGSPSEGAVRRRSRRGERMTRSRRRIYFDYSKNRITDETLRLADRLAEERGLRAKIDAMFRGDKINVTENRAVLHVALRAPRTRRIVVDGKNVVPDVHAVLDKMAEFCQARPQWRVERLYRQAASETSSTSASAAPTSAR